MEESEAIFGTDAELRELLEYTGGAGEEGEEGGGEEAAGVEAEAELLEETSEEDGDFLDLTEEEQADKEERRLRRAEARGRAAERARRGGGKGKHKERLAQLAEPETLKQAMLTDGDEKIRATDLPERLQTDASVVDRPPPEAGEVRHEAQWCYERLFGESHYDSSLPEAAAALLMGRRIEAIEAVLRLLRQGSEACGVRQRAEDGRGARLL